MTNASILSYTVVINKESFRKKKTLFQYILLKKASNDLCNELKTKQNKKLAKFVENNTITTTYTNDVAKSILL
jgi:hypothetical protein